MLNRVGRVLRATYTGTRGRKILNVKDPSASGLVEVEEGRGFANKKIVMTSQPPSATRLCRRANNNKRLRGGTMIRLPAVQRDLRRGQR